MGRLKTLWNSYKYRFVPWLTFNLKYRTVRAVEEGGGEGDSVVGEAEVVEQLFTVITTLQKACPPLPPRPPPHLLRHYSLRNREAMQSSFGYSVRVTPSSVAGLGSGVVLEGQSGASRGQLMALYPGSLYLPQQPVLLPSLANPFILRCADGVLVDGCPKRLSGAIFRSCCSRDRIGFEEAADSSWLTDWHINPLNVGQYVNNQATGRPSNVAYQEVTLQPREMSWGMRRFFPNLWCTLPPDTSQGDLPLRLVALIATTDINVGQELYSNYFTLIHSKTP
ncbi:SET domain-containing protein 9 [Chionoecetes opilio]|uniref:SET domain-containing protein 9 n=1 Tax=Chionoecetes opilio TaxID=41210 RepID=A0A8J4YEW1_CHIOP|nr:SET domain-containing protein 9 [Chionoecetes opilio]